MSGLCGNSIAPLSELRTGEGTAARYMPYPARLTILRAVTPLVEAVDVELNSEICRDVVGLCREHAKPVILSVHDFTSTPPSEELTRCIETGKSRRWRYHQTLDDGDDARGHVATSSSS